MKAIAKLKDDARKFEQKEEWEKAINAYLQVLQIGEQGDGAELDLPLYNRVGDLHVRLGRPSDAVKYYEQAADRYAEAGLYNNAIALCNKALRYDANRLELLRKLGSFSGSQGFFTDARRWYLEYAEKSIKKGALDDAFAALADLADVIEDAETRELLARQLRDHDRKERAVEEFQRAYALRLAAGQQAEADAIRAEIVTLDPNADVSATQQTTHHAAHTYEADQLPGFMDQVATAPVAEPEAEPETEAPTLAEDTLTIEQTGMEGGLDLGGDVAFETINIESGFGGAETQEVEALDIGLEPSLGVSPEEIAEEEETASFDLPQLEEAEAAAETSDEAALSLPGFDDFGLETEAETETEAEPLAELPGFDDFAATEEEIEPLPGFEDFSTEAETETDSITELPPLEVAAPEPVVEEEIEAEPEPAPEAVAPPPPPPPPKKEKEYVDLASFLDDDEEEVAQDSTRFVVAEKPPTGDEEKDFADMLAQFKQKVAESIPTEDAGSHYDLGIAFKEMGLIDEAIGEFQTALRAGQEKLKVYEELGSCFVMKQQYSVAVTLLNRAAQLPHKDENDLLGVYYNLGRAHEELGQRAEAKAAFEKIIAIDIGFQDTTERLSRL
ncbi:MAG: tetratricopeptide repeat protein [Gemmatimonadota bacterium]